MERFNLNTWLEDKSRKIVTRDGKKARIICYDVKQGNDDHYAPIIALVDRGEEIGEMSYYYTEDGSFLRTNQTHNFDLFFADEEEELTDFEKAVEKTIPYKIPFYMLKSISKELIELARKEIEKENSEFKPKFTYNEKDYSKLANKLIEFRNNTPLCSVSYRDGEGRKVILHYEKEILELARKELEKDNVIIDKDRYLKICDQYYNNGKENALKDLPSGRKQKQDWSEEDEKNWRHCLHYIDAYVTPVKEHVDWYKNIRNRMHSQPQQNQEWSEDDKYKLGFLTDMLEGLDPKDFDLNYMKELSNWLKSLKDRIQPKPNQDWSEEDEYLYNWCVSALTTRYNDGLFTTSEYKQTKLWLQSLKDRVQPKQEWSKEDEKILKELLEEVKDQLDSVPSPDCMDKEDEKVLKQLNKWMDWLKSIKYRVQPQPKQEWSKEDKEKQNAIIGILDFQASKAPDRCCATDGYLLDELIDWLKSISPKKNCELAEDCNEIDYSSEVIGFLKNYIKAHGCTAMNSWVKWLEKKCNI